MVSGEFSAFKDPSVTSNQTCYFVPSKSAVVGLLGAMIGIERSSKLDDIYGENYIKFFKQIKIGLEFKTVNPRKIVFFTNHRSLKAAKTKPYKTELVENPIYEIYVKTNEELFSKLQQVLTHKNFVYSPYLGHAYCPTVISDLTTLDVEYMKPDGQTKCVILDPSEIFDSMSITLQEKSNDSSLIVERHLHHFIKDDKLESRVFKYWIPTNGSEFIIDKYSKNNFTEFVGINNNVVCLY